MSRVFKHVLYQYDLKVERIAERINSISHSYLNLVFRDADLEEQTLLANASAVLANEEVLVSHDEEIDLYEVLESEISMWIASGKEWADHSEDCDNSLQDYLDFKAEQAEVNALSQETKSLNSSNLLTYIRAVA